MLTFVTFLWRQPGFHTLYQPSHVERWARMIREHYNRPRRLVVVTELAARYFSTDLEVLPDQAAAWGALRNPWGPAFPSCYRRLWIWSPAAAAELGDRVCLLDLDVAILGDLVPLLERDDDVVLWRDPGYPRQPYNGGMVLLRTGSHPEVWERFRGAASIEQARRRGFKGSDQAWIAHTLGPRMPVWTAADGVVSWKRDLRKGPPDERSRVVMFHGRDQPWDPSMPPVYRLAGAA